MVKRWFAMVCIGVYVGCTLVGSPAAAQDQERITITLGHNKGEGAGFSIKAFEEAHPEIKVLTLPTQRQLNHLYQYPLPASVVELPDVVAIYIGQGSDDLQHLVDNDLIIPLDDLLDDIGIALEGFLPNAANAVERNGAMWALPHQVNCAVLSYRKPMLDHFGIKPDFQSWEGIFNAADQMAGKDFQGQQIAGFWQSTGHLHVCEYIANSVGSPIFQLEDPSFFTSEELFEAYTLLFDYRESGAITPEPGLLVLHPNAAMGINNFTCLEMNQRYGVLELPDRLREDDPPQEPSRVNALLRCYAVKKNVPEKLEAVKTLLEWLLSEENQMNMVLDSHASAPYSERRVPTVHIPLRASILQSDAFQAVVEETPEYQRLVDLVKSVYFPNQPGELELTAFKAASEVVDQNYRDLGVRAALQMAYEKVLETVRSATVETSEFDQY